MSRVLIPLAKGFEDLEAVAAVDVLRRGEVEVVTASISDSLEVESAHGVTMKADRRFAEVAGEEFDAILLPGGGEGTRNLLECKPLLERLRRQKRDDKFLCAICAAPTVLVKAGVLDPGQHVTCYPSCASELDRPSANVPAVADGRLVTGQAPGSALLFALVVLHRLEGESTARRVAHGMVTNVLAAR